MKRYFVILFFLMVLLLSQKSLLIKFYKTGENIDSQKNQKDYIKNQDVRKSEFVVDKKNIYPNIKKLMIVAHPDDESYWGGAHLLEDDYLVVCITCGTVPYRVTEFKKAMALTKDEYIMLGYPDLTNGKKDNWDLVYASIKKDLKDIINAKTWEQIVTHNPDGEYGHIHHKMTNEMVTELSDLDVLWYFGRYYTKHNIKNANNIKKISDKSSKLKEEKLIPIYKSQKNAENMFKHMFNYENFVFNKNWKVNL